MKKSLIAVGSILLITLAGIIFFLWDDPSKITIRVASQSPAYAEYLFESKQTSDLGFTHTVFALLQTQEPLLSAGGTVVPNPSLINLPITEYQSMKGIVARMAHREDVYELWHDVGNDFAGLYRMTKNGQFLFAHAMDVGAEGPLIDQKIIDEKPAFTFIASCATKEQNRVICETDVWYDGSFLSEVYDVQSPRQPFVYGERLGFVASHNGKDGIFYNNAFITPDFDRIWTHNCCSSMEILPTLYNNGVLFFYAERNQSRYLVEMLLTP